MRVRWGTTAIGGRNNPPGRVLPLNDWHPRYKEDSGDPVVVPGSSGPAETLALPPKLNQPPALTFQYAVALNSDFTEPITQVALSQLTEVDDVILPEIPAVASNSAVYSPHHVLTLTLAVPTPSILPTPENPIVPPREALPVHSLYAQSPDPNTEPVMLPCAPNLITPEKMGVYQS